MDKETCDKILKEQLAAKTKQKTVVEQIDAILEVDADNERKVHKDSIPSAIWRVGNKIDTLNKLIAIALKQKYGRQN